MTRLVPFVLAAGLVGIALTARAAEPLRTKMTVPTPTFAAGAVLPTGMTTAPAVVEAVPAAGCSDSCGPRRCNILSSLSLFRRSNDCGETAGICKPKLKWCEDCTPTVRHPLPPLPGGVLEPTCHPRQRAAANCDRDCLSRMKEWLCFRQTPVHLPLTPTPRIAPFYTYFPCTDGPGCAAGGCATGGHGGLRLPARGAVGSCTPCPQGGEAILPGYRLANPGGVAPVVSASYSKPMNLKK